MIFFEQFRTCLFIFLKRLSFQRVKIYQQFTKLRFFLFPLNPVATNLTPIRGSLIHGFFLCMVITYQKMVFSFWKRNMIVPSTSENWESVVSSYKNGHRPEKNVQLRLGRFNKKIVNSNNDKNNNIKIPESNDVTVLKKNCHRFQPFTRKYAFICVKKRTTAWRYIHDIKRFFVRNSDSITIFSF